jgi:hypothetical protein
VLLVAFEEVVVVVLVVEPVVASPPAPPVPFSSSLQPKRDTAAHKPTSAVAEEGMGIARCYAIHEGERWTHAAPTAS